jgi:hypothetical protein
LNLPREDTVAGGVRRPEKNKRKTPRLSVSAVGLGLLQELYLKNFKKKLPLTFRRAGVFLRGRYLAFISSMNIE